EALRLKGAKDVNKRAGRTAANGLVAVELDATSAGVLLELNCETDFVAKTDLFQQAASDNARAALAASAADRLAVLALEVRPGQTTQQLVAEAGAQVAMDIAHQIAAMRPQYVTRDEVPADLVAGERRIAEQLTRDEGKPEQAIPKIVEGRLGGFFKDVALVEQPTVRDQKRTVKQLLAEHGAAVAQFARFQI